MSSECRFCVTILKNKKSIDIAHDVLLAIFTAMCFYITNHVKFLYTVLIKDHYNKQLRNATPFQIAVFSYWCNERTPSNKDFLPHFLYELWKEVFLSEKSHI